MNYRTVYLDAQVLAPQGGAPAVVEKVQAIVNQHAEQGWTFIGVQQVQTTVTNPGSNGCVGIGAIPTRHDSVAVNMLVFSAP